MPSSTIRPAMSSPRPRGLLLPGVAELLAQTVVPAPAGVARHLTGDRPPRPRRPRARGGCSMTDTEYSKARRVVPAPAGVAPRRSRPTAVRGRRPRARGGCSRRESPCGVLGASSPRPRGLLRRPHRPHLARGVVPAPAGVAPGPSARRARRAGRPRARGGCSSNAEMGRVVAASSPRPRGLLPSAPAVVSETGVVPAPAGVARHRARHRRPLRGRPRARGGCSVEVLDHVDGAESSPRPRGLLRVDAGGQVGQQVVPAPAGVARPARPWASSRRRRPRARGGCSGRPTVGVCGARSSPRPRGLLHRTDKTPTLSDVVPAPAGVARRSAATPTSRARRPRARGGCSPVVDRIFNRTASSPRPRGLLQVPDEQILDLGVVPAPAGVALRAAASAVAGGTSSPRPRGLLDGVIRVALAAAVVPAPAGVAPADAAHPVRVDGRPRARGGCSPWLTELGESVQSSPRPRGLLAAGVSVPEYVRVVPAPAGVAPGTTSSL